VADRPFLSRRERFDRVGSTNDVVRGWLVEGTPEVCLAIADEQTDGRGREGRRWIAPPGAAMLLSLGFRPVWLSPPEAWQLGALTSMAMAEAAEIESGLPSGTIRLKWPNDLVVASDLEGELRKVAGVLGETEGLGTREPRVVIGIGLNVDWAAVDFPAELATSMTSLSEVSGTRVDRGRLLEQFLDRLEARLQGLRNGRFDGLGWTVRQATTGRTIRLETPAGVEDVRAMGVDVVTGALVVEATGVERKVLAGEVTHVRLATPTDAGERAHSARAV
jgi:BirA family transcriptional regulator, biotin operon repressor / biotin---[acetyl-CoA-carboxylase] ligase